VRPSKYIVDDSERSGSFRLLNRRLRGECPPGGMPSACSFCLATYYYIVITIVVAVTFYYVLLSLICNIDHK